MFIRNTSKCTLKDAGCDVLLLSQQICGVRKEQKEPPCLYLGNFPGLETLGPCLHAVAVLKHSFVKLLWLNSLLCVHLIQCCAALTNRALEVFVAPVCNPGQLRVLEPVPHTDSGIWDPLSSLQLTHHQTLSSFSLHLLPVEQALQGLQMSPVRSRSGSSAAAPAVLHICTQPELRQLSRAHL